MTGADRAARSRAAFAERFPEIAAALTASTLPSSLVFEGDVPVNVILGDRAVYGGDARAQSAEQVDAFMAQPMRFLMESPSNAGLMSEVCIGLKRGLERTLHEAGATEMSREPVGAPTFLVVFGVGLGYHLEALIRRTAARWVIIVEPIAELIDYSFQAVEWQTLFDEVEGRGGAIHVVTEFDPSRMVTAILGHVGRHGTPYLDGTWIFAHYPLWALVEARKRLHGAAEFSYVNRGFFEDEMVMMRNAVGNFARHAFALLDRKPRRHRPEKAAIVGAGPSLDEAIETLHRVRDRVVLFSAGTALRPLLRNGLLPDFHCELENGPQVPEVLAETGRYGDLSQVRLIASATVDPRVPAMFGETFLFFRDSVSSTRILRGAAQPLAGTAPTCVNTAIASATALGFTDFALFGVDCGLRPGMADHAAGTIYRDIDKWQQHSARARYPLEVDGNFGGIAATNWVYDACRRMLAEHISVFRLAVVNCSDGALIPGATPRVAEAFEVGGPAIDRPRLLAELKQTMRQCRPGEMLREPDLAGLREKNRAMHEDLRAVFDGFDGERADFAGAYDALMSFTRGAGAQYGFANALIEGTLSALPRIAMFYGSRLRNEAVRRLVFAAYMDELRRIAMDMEQRGDALLGELAAMSAAPEAALA
jgi:hypothetical protein